MLEKLTLDFIQKFFKEKGITILNKSYNGSRDKIYFKCRKCGEVTYTLWDNFRKGYNTEFLCKHCQTRKTPKVEEIRQIMLEAGATPLFTEYKTGKDKLPFLCSKCGKEHYTTWSAYYNKKQNLTFLCKDCLREKLKNTVPSNKKSFEEIKAAFEAKGVQLLNTSYKNANEPLYFNCKKCGKQYHITWAHFQRNDNPSMCCPECRGNTTNSNIIPKSENTVS